MDSNKMDIISTLPTENGWLSDKNAPLYYYKGFWYYGHFIRGVIAIANQELHDFKPSSTDIIICSTPKSGTTWLKALCYAIATRSRFHNGFTDSPLHSTIPHELIPLIEVDIAQKGKSLGDLPLFSTHLPYELLADSILSDGCKIVYIWRDLKDAFISRWLFAQKMRPNKDVTQPIPLKEAFDLFCKGISPFGPYWDHVLGYWEASLNRPDKIMFFKYEDMINNTEVHVKRLAKFMGYPFSIEEEKEGVISEIVKLCSFESMSNVNKGGDFRSLGPVTITRDAFFRKGKVGDWRNYLSEEMANKMDQITADKLGKLGLPF